MFLKKKEIYRSESGLFVAEYLYDKISSKGMILMDNWVWKHIGLWNERWLKNEERLVPTFMAAAYSIHWKVADLINTADTGWNMQLTADILDQNQVLAISCTLLFLEDY